MCQSLRHLVRQKMTSVISRLRQASQKLLPHHHHQHRRNLSPESKTLRESKEKSLAALSLLRSETNPERILEICRSASLTPESPLDRTAFCVAVSKLAKSQHFEAIRLYLDELKTRPDLLNERFAAHSILLYGQAGMLDNAVKSFEDMNRLGISPSVKSLNALLFSCILAKDYKHVRKVFDEFPKRYGIEPDLESYNTVIRAHCVSGESNAVYSMLDEMGRNERCKPNATTYGTIIAGFYREGKFDDVMKVLEIMKRDGVPPGAATFNIRIKSLCVLNESAKAKALFDEMLLDRIQPNSATYFELIHGFCKEKKFEEAKGFYDDMVSRGIEPQSDCYFTLVYYLCQGGDFDYALRVCKESMKKNWVPNFATMKSLVDGLVSIGMVSEANELVNQMKKKLKKNVDMWNEVQATLPQ